MSAGFYESRFVEDGFNRWHELADRALGAVLEPGQSVAEFGCGNGEYLRHLVDSCEVSGVGYDISRPNVEHARSLGLECEVVDFAAERWPVESSSFDCGVALDVLEHLFDPRHFLREVHRCLKPGGGLVVTTPNGFHLRRRIAFAAGFHRDPNMDPSRVDLAVHIQAFSYPMLCRLMQAVGFTIELELGNGLSGVRLPGLHATRRLTSSHVCVIGRVQE